MSRSGPQVGDVIQVALSTGRYAYGRVLRDASVAFYSETTAEPGLPPIGSRDYQFVVGVYDDVPGSDGPVAPVPLSPGSPLCEPTPAESRRPAGGHRTLEMPGTRVAA